MIRLLPIALLSAALGCAARSTGPRLSPAAQALTGTYAFQLCRGPCSLDAPDAAYLTGVLVLRDAPIDSRRLPRAARGRLDTVGYVVEPLTACFAVRRRREFQESFAGITPAALTGWRLLESDSAVTLFLMTSPDADYRITFRATADTIRGTGRSWGAGNAAVSWPADSLVGRRLGVPDPSACVPTGSEDAG